VLHSPRISTLALNKWPTFVSIDVSVSSPLVSSLIQNGGWDLEAIHHLFGINLEFRFFNFTIMLFLVGCIAWGVTSSRRVITAKVYKAYLSTWRIM